MCGRWHNGNPYMSQISNSQDLRDDINLLVQHIPIEVMRRMPDTDSVLDYLLACIDEIIIADALSIFLMDEGKLKLSRRLFKEPEKEKRFAVTIQLDEFPNIERAYTSRETILTRDTQDTDQWITTPDSIWIRSHIAAPMFTQDEFLGFLFIQSQTPNQYTEEDVKRLQPLVAQTSMAVHLAQMYQQQTQTTQELEALYNATSVLLNTDNVYELGSQIALAVVKEFDHVDCGVILVDLYSPQLIRLPRAGVEGLSASEPLFLHGPGLVPASVRSGVTTYAADVRQDVRYVANVPEAMSELVIPLRTHNNIIGVLDLQSTHTNAFGPNEVRVLEAFAQRAAVAIENARLYEEIRTFATDQEQLLAERTLELREAKEQVETILNFSSDGVAFTTRDGKIIRTNTTFEKIFGTGALRTEKGNVSIIDLIDIDSEQPNGCAEALKRVASGASQSERLIATTINRDVSAIYIDTTLAAVRNARGRISGIVFTVRDITDLKKMEEGLRLALAHEMELNQLKSQFIAVVSHEFRTPLATILSAKDGLQRYYDRLTEEQRQRNYTQIDTNVLRMTEMLDDLLSLTQDDSHQRQQSRERIDLSAEFGNTFEDLRASIGTGYDLQFEVVGTPRLVYCNTKQMQQIFRNLVENAIKYSSEDKQVHIKLEYLTDWVQLVVTDKGIGIPEPDKLHIFDPFIRGSNVGTKRGTGLGLSIVKQAVDNHSGKIVFNSLPGGGTAFLVSVPYESDPNTENDL